MRIINFLPDDYLQRRRCRRATHLCLIVSGGALAIMTALSCVVWLRAAAVADTRATVERQYREASKQIETLKDLELRRDGLLRKVGLSTDLLERVPRSVILARLTNALPSKTWVQLVSMGTKDVKARSPASPAGAGVRGGPGGRSSVAPPVPVVVSQTEFVLDGLAETDVQVAEYIARLSADPFFSEVNLRFSEAFPLEEGLMVRRFEIVFHLSAAASRLLEAKPVESAFPVTRGGT